MTEKHSFDYMTVSERKTVAQTLINHTENHLHNINDVLIVKYSYVFVSVNRKSLAIKVFDSEQEALDFVLDFYKWSDSGKQQELF